MTWPVCADCGRRATTRDRGDDLCGDCIWARFEAEMAYRRAERERRGVPAPAVHARGSGRPFPWGACPLHFLEPEVCRCRK